MKAVLFHRYAGCNDVDTGVRMPTAELDANVHNLCVSELMGRLERFVSGEEGPQMYPWTNRFVMGYPLPAWQRPLVWTDGQKVRFIQSLWAGVDVGSYMVNDVYEFVNLGRAGTHYREFSEVLLDGQQRLSALEDYLYNRFAVPDAAGVPRYWKDLPRIERRRFGSLHFAKATVKSWDERYLRKAYDLRSFGGTPHTEDQRASLDINPFTVGNTEVISAMVRDLLPKADPAC